MLETTLATRFVPGSNRKNDRAGAHWIFCLDRLDLGRALCLGAPSTTTLDMVAPLADEVMVWEPQAAKRRALLEWLDRSGRRNVSVAERPQASWQLHELRADLLLPHGPWNAADVADALKPSGSFYVETRPPAGKPAIAVHPGIKTTTLRLTPSLGEIRTAIPLEDTITADYFARHRMHATHFRRGLLAKAERMLTRHGLVTPGRLGFLGSSERSGRSQPPAYLRRLAHLNGLDLERHRWGLWARGDYRSQKVLFYLFAGTAETPDLVVKMVRDASFNARLENEYRVLSRLRGLSSAHRDHVPEALFLGHPGNLSAVGERVIEGAPFTSRTDGSADCMHARQAVEWLTDVARDTARPMAAPRVADVLRELCSRFEAIYNPAPAESTFLRQQIARVAASPWPVPAVLQHGDPGPWNLCVRADGRVVFLDWEAAEEQGMPLWDLFYFLRSYVLLGRVRGVQRRLETFASTFLADSPLSGLVRQAVEEYCVRVGLHPSLVEPLFFTCWMHRALKESARLHPQRLAEGRFLAVLRHCIAHRESPGLRRLFDLPQPATV